MTRHIIKRSAASATPARRRLRIGVASPLARVISWHISSSRQRQSAHQSVSWRGEEMAARKLDKIERLLEKMKITQYVAVLMLCCLCWYYRHDARAPA